MPKTPFSNMCKILGDFWYYNREVLQDRGWQDFIIDEGPTLALAYCLSSGSVTLADNDLGILASREIEDAYVLLCEGLGISTDIAYGSLEEIYDDVLSILKDQDEI